MTDYKQLCIDILRYWDAAGTPSDFIDTNGYGTIQRIRAALAKSESSGDVTDSNHPITPPPELVEQWSSESLATQHLCTRAARWGADQELEACCEWVSQWRCMVGGNRPEIGLRAARRPKPPSLKEQALAELELLKGDANSHGLGFDAPAIRRALEALPE